MPADQRKTKRFELKLPFELLRASTIDAAGGCETQNMSSGGVLFSSGARMEVGEVIEYMITLPSSTDPGTRVRLRCKGKVLRSEPRASGPRTSTQFAVAASLERYEFVREQTRRAS